MKTLKFRNHNINLIKNRDEYIISPYAYTNESKQEEFELGEISMNKMELAVLIVNLTSLMHNE